MDLVCIVCPKGCKLSIDEKGEAFGASCKRGVDFAKTELSSPTRTVCSTVSTTFSHRPVLPVRTSGEIPKDKIFAFMDFVKTVKVDKAVKCGEVLAENILGLNVNLIATDDLEQSLNIYKQPPFRAVFLQPKTLILLSIKEKIPLPCKDF